MYSLFEKFGDGWMEQPKTDQDTTVLKAGMRIPDTQVSVELGYSSLD